MQRDISNIYIVIAHTAPTGLWSSIVQSRLNRMTADYTSELSKRITGDPVSTLPERDPGRRSGYAYSHRCANLE